MRTITARLSALAACCAALSAVPGAAHAAATPPADLCGATNGDYVQGQASHDYNGTLSRFGETDQMTVTFWAGAPSTQVAVSGATANDSVIALGSIRDTNGQGSFTFQTPDGTAANVTVTCASGSTTVTRIEGATDNGTFAVTG